MKIVSLCPSNTELLHYLGLTDSIAGVDDFSDWPKEIQSLSRLGPDLKIDMDKVEELNPDLVVASLSVPGMERNVEELIKRNIPHIVLNPNTLAEIAESIVTLGKATGTLKKALKIQGKFHDLIRDYRQKCEAVNKRKHIYWEWWPKPVFTPGGPNWLSEISDLAGGVNVFADRKEPSIETDWEEVRKKDPDVICLVWVGTQQNRVKPELLFKRPGWPELDAMKENNIFVLEESLFCRPSPRLFTGLQKIAAILHPNVFSGTKDVEGYLTEE